MFRGAARKVTPRVRDGRAQPKDRRAQTQGLWSLPEGGCAVVRERPGRDHKHVLEVGDVERYLGLLPGRDEVVRGLRAVVLAREEYDTEGWYDHRGVIGLCAWGRELWREVTPSFYEEHREVLARLGVECVEALDEEWDERYVECRFTEASARAWKLNHILLHELGHHHDRLTTRSKRHPARGEGYAERYAVRHEAEVWGRFCEAFNYVA